MTRTRGRVKVDDATQALIRREVRKATAQPVARRGSRTAPVSRSVGMSVIPSKADMERVARIRGQQRARRMPFLLWFGTVALASAVWGVCAAVAAIYGQWPRTITALSFGTVVLAAAGITRAVKHSQLADPRWRRRVWLAGVAAAATVSAAGLWGWTWQLLGFTVTADWVLASLWWREHRITGAVAPAPQVETHTDWLSYYAEMWALNNACTGGPCAGALLSDGHYTEHTVAFSCQLKPGTGGIATVLSRIDAISSGLRSDPSTVLFDHHPLEPGERRDSSRILLQIVIDSPIEETVFWREPMFDGGSIGLGPYADGDGLAQVVLYTENSAWPVTILGSIGSGKTAVVNGLIASARAALPCTTLYVDGKGGASSPELGENSSVYVTQRDEFLAFARAMERLTEFRKALQASRGHSGFVASRDFPLILLPIDECHVWFEDPEIAKIFVRLVTLWRSLGIVPIYLSQHSGLEVYGGKEQIRSNACAGTILGMRCLSRIAQHLLHRDLGDLTMIPAGGGWGYAVGQQATRQTMFRAAHLPSRQDCPDGFNSAVALSMYPDVPLDEGSRLALGEEWFAGDERREQQQQALAERMAYLTGGWRNPSAAPTRPAAIAASSGGPAWVDPALLPASEPVDDDPAPLSDISRRIVAVINEHPEGISPGMVAFPLGLSPNSAATYLGRLVGEGHVRKLARGLFGPITTVTTDTTPAGGPVAEEQQPRAYAHARETPIVDTQQARAVVIAEKEPNVPEELRNCGDCAVQPGQPHVPGCDVARCLVTGRQRIQCAADGRYNDPGDDEDRGYDHEGDCGDDVWTGVWPGDAECREFGWYSKFVPPAPGQHWGEWVQTTADDPDGSPDLNRLCSEQETRWDRDAKRWVLR